MADVVLKNGLVDIGGGEFRRADVAIEGGRIASVGEGTSGGEVVDCTRFAVVPGIVNSHNHSNENWFRGRFDNLPLEPWMLFSYPVLANPVQTDREIYVRTLLGGLEMLRSGATCVVDYVYELAGWTEESIGAVARAYRDLGLRAVIVIGMSDRSYDEVVVLDLNLVPDELRKRFGPEKPPDWPEWEAFSRFAVERYHRPDEGISIGLGPSGPQRCTDEMLTACAALAEELDHEARKRHRRRRGAPRRRHQRRHGHGRDELERRQRRLRDAQGRRPPAQALGHRLRALARRTRGVADGDPRRRAGCRRRRARRPRAGEACRPRPARPREPRLHAAERPAPARRLLLDDDRGPLDDGRRPL